MECPKCGLEIDDNALVCPNCKKVLKLACPICKSINENNVCKKCGYVILSKCHNCGKINPTETKKCKKCGFDTEKSIIMNECNGDDYALMIVELPNIATIKNILGSARLYNKFKINIDKIIMTHAKSLGLRCQIINNRYFIRFGKDYTFKSSAHSAIDASIGLINKITAMNCKLSKRKNSTVRCNIFIEKKNVNDNPNELNVGVNISLLDQHTKTDKDKILGTFQVLVDDEVHSAIENDYKVEQLNTTIIDGKAAMIYEVDVKEFIKVEFPPEEQDNDEIEIPNFVQNMLIEQDKIDGEALYKMNSSKIENDSIYDINTINFEEIRCNFIRTENIDAVFHIMNILQENPKSIVAIKTPEMYKPYTLKILNAAAQTGKYNNIITLTCYDEMKYAPYSFFRDLVSTIFEYTISQKLFFQNDFSMFQSVDPDGLIKDLVTLQFKDDSNIEDKRYVYYDIFLTLLKIIPGTLIYIEDFEKIDKSSYDVLKFIFQNFEQVDVSFLISFDKTFSLHKDAHFLLMQPYYTEIALTSTKFETMIADNKNYYKDVLHDFYFQRVAKYSCGSGLFMDFAMQYLIESGIYQEDEDAVHMVNPKTIIIPSNLDKLLSRRINLLEDEPEVIKFLTSIVLLGTRVDMAAIECLEFENYNEILEKLENLGYIYQYNNSVYFPNYNLLKRNLLNSVNKITLTEIANFLFSKVFNESELPTVTEANLYNILSKPDKEFEEWNQLAQVDLSLGDFSAYINCAEKMLEILNENINTDLIDNIEDRKNIIYENIAKYMNDYQPGINKKLAFDTLRHIEKSSDMDNFILLSNKMINGALNNGDYNHALDLTHQVLSVLPASSINPADENYNPYFFLMSLIHIQILFNVGSFFDCIDVAYRVLNVVNNDTLAVMKPEHLSDEDFNSMIIDTVAYVLFANIVLLTGKVQDFLNVIKPELSIIPDSFDIFVQLENLLTGKNVDIDEYKNQDVDIYSGYILNIIQAFNNINGDYNDFAKFAYEAKIYAKYINIHQLELFADLMVAYAYILAQSYDKAEYIISQIINTTNKNGMSFILYFAWFVMSELYIRLSRFKVAFGILSNSLIHLEKNDNSSEYLLMLFKYNMYKTLMYLKQYDKAEICISHARYLAMKHGVNFNFDVDPQHYIGQDVDDETIEIDTSQITDYEDTVKKEIQDNINSEESLQDVESEG